MIILTAAQADVVRGPTGPETELMPRALADGTYALPEAVLIDPAQAVAWPVLNGLPTRTVAPDEWAT